MQISDRQLRVTYLVRHAHAGVRRQRDDDVKRSLSEIGHCQALDIGQLLAPTTTGTIVSSPLRRCIDTVAPSARRLGRGIETSVHLCEGGDTASMRRLLDTIADRSVVCTHGENLTELISDLAYDGVAIPEPIEFEKGAIWSLVRSANGNATLEVLLDPHRDADGHLPYSAAS